MDATMTDRDLQTAQKALVDIYRILAAIKSGDDNTFYEIGRAMGTASHGLTMSGHLLHPTKGGL